MEEEQANKSVICTYSETLGRAQMDVDIGKCAMQRNREIAEALIEHIFSPTKAESDFERESEESNKEQNFGVDENTKVQEDHRSSFEGKPESEPSTSAYSEGSGGVLHEVQSSSQISGISQMMEINQAHYEVKQGPSVHNKSWQERKQKLDEVSIVPLSTQPEEPDDVDQQNIYEKMEVILKEEEPDSPAESNRTNASVSEGHDFPRQVTISPGAESPVNETDEMESSPRFVGHPAENNSEGNIRENVLSVWQYLMHGGNSSEIYSSSSTLFNTSSSAMSSISSSDTEDKLQGLGVKENVDARKATSSGAGDTCFKGQEKQKRSRKRKPSSSATEQKKTSQDFRCGSCGKCFHDLFNFERHEMIHSGDKPFGCPLCKKTFSIKGALTQHLKMHSDERPFKCNSCEKSFKTRSQLECHKRLHTGEKPFLCKECGKSFRQRSNLTSHLEVHSKMKPYKCTECGKGFSQSSHLNTHMRTHTSEKPYKCLECEKAFSQKVTLSKHMRVHTGERPFACEDCDYRFTKLMSLHSHRSRIHGVTFSVPKRRGRGRPRQQ